MSDFGNSGIYLAVDGGPMPAHECCWVTYAPCGCVSGVCLVDVGGDEILATEALALGFIYENKEVRDESIRQGFTLKLLARQAFNAIDSPFGKCPHIPLWGYEPTPVPEGMVWATTDSWSGRNTHRKHLIAEDAADNWSSTDKPLCGRDRLRAQNSYSTKDTFVSSCAECAKCRAKALELCPSLAVTA